MIKVYFFLSNFSKFKQISCIIPLAQSVSIAKIGRMKHEELRTKNNNDSESDKGNKNNDNTNNNHTIIRII